MGLKSAGEVRALNALLAGCYVGLHTGDPSGANEVAGGSYARQAYPYSLTGTDPTVAANTAIIQFPVATASWGALTYFGLWTAAVGGSLVAVGPLTTSKTIDTDDVARFPIGTLQFKAD